MNYRLFGVILNFIETAMQINFSVNFFVCFLLLPMSAKAQEASWRSASSACDSEIQNRERYLINHPSYDGEKVRDATRRLLENFIRESPYERPHWSRKIEYLSRSVGENEMKGSFQHLINGDNVAICVYKYRIANDQIQGQVVPSDNVEVGARTLQRQDRRDSIAGDINQSLALAQQNQAKADAQAQKDGRRKNNAGEDASHCLVFNPGMKLLQNTCSYGIETTSCAVKPKPVNSNAMDATFGFDCGQGKGHFGAAYVGPGKHLIGMYPHRADGGLLFGACKKGSYPVDSEVKGDGMVFRCM